MTSNRIAYTGFVAFVSALLTLVVVNMVQSSPESQSSGNNDEGETVYRLDQVAEHNSSSSCWKVIEGVVYDVTGYLPDHPTDEETFTRWCGKEATAAWQDKGGGRSHSPRAAARLEKYRIGVIERGDSVSAPVPSVPASADAASVSLDSHSRQMMLGLAPGNYLDGTYRGNFSDRGEMQVGLQFKLKQGILRDVSYRHLYYRGHDYLNMDEQAELYPVLRQYQQAAEAMEGQPLSAMFRLYEPEEVVEDIDVYTGATLHANKVISAFRDGLNRGVYRW